MKIKIIITLIIALILIGTGLIWSINFNNEKGIIKSPTKNINEKNCVEDFCIDNIEIVYKDKLGTISFMMKNKGKKKIKAGFFKIICDNNKELSYISYHSEMEPGSSQNAEIQFEEAKTKKIKKYRIESLTKKEQKESETLFYKK